MEALYPDGRREMLSQVTDFNFNWHNMYIYADNVAPLLPKGTILHLLACARQHEREPLEPRSRSVGRLGRPHDRRDGPRVVEHHVTSATRNSRPSSQNGRNPSRRLAASAQAQR